MKRALGIAIVVAALLLLAVGGWVVDGVRRTGGGRSRPARHRARTAAAA